MTTRRTLWMHKLTDEVVRSITEEVRKGDAGPGTSLGTREDLSREFVTSTGVIDRALELLKADGIVNETGKGEVVVAAYRPPEHGFELPGDATKHLPDVIAILELRLGVEVQAATLAATRRTLDQLADVRDANEALEKAAEQGEGAARADFAFHRAVSVASGNPYILELLDYLGPLLIPRMRLSIAGDTNGRDKNLADAISEHREIVRMIGQQDPTGAGNAMRSHLQRTIQLVSSLAPAGTDR